jgi:ABC-type antimicrobial peptide transport system permease subunit
MALGAQKSGVKWMFVRSALTLTCVGIGIGLATEAALVQFMRTLLFGVHPIDPVTFIAVPVVLVMAAIVASYLPAARAAVINAVDALKAQ